MDSTPPRFTVKGYLIIGGIFFIFLCMAVVFFSSVRKRNAAEQCRLNLVYLGMGVNNVVYPADKARWDEMPTGGAFWLAHENWPARPVRDIRQETLLCPVKGPVKRRTGTDYRGPARSLNRLEPADPMGADRTDNHGAGQGGSVLLRSGEVFEAKESDTLWSRAAQTTGD